MARWNNVKTYICAECEKEFIPQTHGKMKKFCCYSCSAKHQWRTREREVKKPVYRDCKQCGKTYEKPQKYSIQQWSRNKYCSYKCSGDAKKIRDGMTKGERHRRKKGISKFGTPEWLDKIRATTKDAMNKPEIKAKISKPRSPLTEDHKGKISDALVGKMPANTFTSSYANIYNGHYDTGKGSIYFRSRWEANYALYLDFLIKNDKIKDWEYESDRFEFKGIKYGTRTYLPDFKVFNNDGSIEYHEVKGYMNQKSKTKLKRMAIYYPDVKLVLVDSRAYNSIKKQLGKIIGFYE